MMPERRANLTRRSTATSVDRTTNRERLIINGAFINWMAFVVSVVASLFLSPFVVHRLGNVAYGVWIVANSSIAYMALLDLGMRGAVTHFIAKHHSREEHFESSGALSAALAFRALISLAVIVGSLVLAAIAIRIFQIPSDMWTAAQAAIIITGFSLSFNLIVGVFSGVLTGLQRFDLASGLAIAQTLVGGAGTVWVLGEGHGIVALAIMQLIVSLIVGIVTISLCFRVYPELRVGVRFLDKGSFAELWRYSVYLFIIAATGQVVYYTDNLVVGAFLSAEAVTVYAIGGRFIEYLGQLGASLSQTFLPAASHLAAQDRQDDLRRLLIQGTRAALFVSLPVGWALFAQGPAFIGLWMGSQYAETSGQILRILLLSTLPLAGNRVAGNIVFGLGKHKRFALWQCCEAVANLTLSVYLVRRIGIYGVAWGTVLPSLICQLVLWPRYISKLLGLPVHTYYWEGWIRPTLATLPFCLACIWINEYCATTSLVRFFIQMSAALPLVPLGILLCFWPGVKSQLGNQDSLFRRGFLTKLHPDGASSL